MTCKRQVLYGDGQERVKLLSMCLLSNKFPVIGAHLRTGIAVELVRQIDHASTIARFEGRIV